MARERLKPAADYAAAWRSFTARADLASSLAADIASALAEAIAERGVGFLAVSGGTTPAAMFGALSTAQIDWSEVVVTLVDERNVPESSPRSNAALVRSNLMRNRAAAARLVGLRHQAGTVDAAAELASRSLADLPWPLDVAVLGMGTDGHTASFFPDARELGALLAPRNPLLVMPVHSASAGEPRLTLPLSRIVEAGWLALHIEGNEKKAVLEAALTPGGERPVSAVFRQRERPIDIYWAP